MGIQKTITNSLKPYQKPDTVFYVPFASSMNRALRKIRLSPRPRTGLSVRQRTQWLVRSRERRHSPAPAAPEHFKERWANTAPGFWRSQQSAPSAPLLMRLFFLLTGDTSSGIYSAT